MNAPIGECIRCKRETTQSRTIKNRPYLKYYATTPTTTHVRICTDCLYLLETMWTTSIEDEDLPLYMDYPFYFPANKKLFLKRLKDYLTIGTEPTPA